MFNGAGARKDIEERIEALFRLALKNATHSSLVHLRDYMIEKGVLRSG